MAESIRTRLGRVHVPARRGGNRRSPWRARAVLIAVVVAVVAVGGGVAYAVSGPSGPQYRTATAGTGSVTQTVTSVGTVASVNKAALTFGASGRVASVSVHVGDPVVVGAQLAALDPTSLNQALSQAQQTLANDQQKLAEDQSGQTSTSPSASLSSVVTGTGASGPVASTDAAGVRLLAATSATGPSTTTAPAGGTSAASGATGASGGLGSAQQAVTAAQQKLTTDQKALDALLSDSSLADLGNLVATDGPCAVSPPKATTLSASTDSAGHLSVTVPVASSVTAGAATVAAPTQTSAGYVFAVTGSPSTAYTLTITPSAGTIDASTCTAALQKLVGDLNPGPSQNAWTDAQAVTADELSLASAITALEKAAAAGGTGATTGGSTGSAGSTGSRTGSTTGSGTTGSSTSRTGTTASGSSGSATTGSGSRTGSTGSGATGQGSATSPPTPEQIAADQAAIDAAAAEVAVAQQNLQGVVLRSPIAGTVAAVALTQGASAGTNAITVIGPGAEEVNTTVTVGSVDLVKVGQSARVNVDGIGTALTGKVTAIGVLTGTSGSTTTYPVTVLLDPTAQKLFDGAGAAVAITVSSVSGVLTVPSSAVHSLGTTLHTVTVLADGKATTTRVGLGAVGMNRTQITSGLKAGEAVVLARLDAALPTSTTTNRTLRGTGITTNGGGLTGGGLTGGGLTGGTGGATGGTSGGR